jgi:hypothetical protein
VNLILLIDNVLIVHASDMADIMECTVGLALISVWMLILTIHFHIESHAIRTAIWTSNMFNLFIKYGIGLHTFLLFCFCRPFNKLAYNGLTFKLELMTTQYIKDRKYNLSNHMFSHGACSDWPVRSQVLTHLQLVYSLKPSLFAPPPATAAIIPVVKIAQIFLAHPRTFSASAKI